MIFPKSGDQAYLAGCLARTSAKGGSTSRRKRWDSSAAFMSASAALCA